MVNEPQEISTFEERHTALFDRILAPLTRSLFLTEFWNKSYVRVPGHRGKFGSLFTWDDLNAVLEQHRLEPPRLRLVRDAKDLDWTRFCFQKDGRLRLKPASLIKCLSEGATLILDNVQELAPAIREVTDACEHVLRARTLVNLYASWRTQKGFDLHWDDQDTVILQLSGRKRWKVFQPTRLHPLRDDQEEAPKPDGEPLWDGVLEDGDMLYMPRGWWHIAFPLDEPTLHLTVTIVPADGVTLLRWFTDELKRHPEVRMNVPHLADPAKRSKYVSRVRELMIEGWTDDILERFIVDHEANIPVPPRIRLPGAPIESQAALTMQSQVRLAANRRLSIRKISANYVSFRANDVRWECSSNLVPALEKLSCCTSHSLQQLCAQLADRSLASKLTVFLTALSMGGAIWIENREQ